MNTRRRNLILSIVERTGRYPRQAKGLWVVAAGEEWILDPAENGKYVFETRLQRGPKRPKVKVTFHINAGDDDVAFAEAWIARHGGWQQMSLDKKEHEKMKRLARGHIAAKQAAEAAYVEEEVEEVEEEEEVEEAEYAADKHDPCLEDAYRDREPLERWEWDRVADAYERQFDRF